MSDSARSVHVALMLLAADIADGRPVLEARLLDAGGEVESAAMEALERLDHRAVPFNLGFREVGAERQDYWLLLLAEVVDRVQHADTPEALEAAAWSIDTLRLTAERGLRGS